MREIKFRALTKDRKGIPGEKWVYWKLGETPNYSCLDMGTVGEFIGLHDKKGKEIYEWDIIKFKHRRSEILTDLFPPQVVEDITDIPIQVWMSVVCQGSSKEPDGEIEVIGNIYENPELLTEKKQTK